MNNIISEIEAPTFLLIRDRNAGKAFEVYIEVIISSFLFGLIVWASNGGRFMPETEILFVLAVLCIVSAIAQFIAIVNFTIAILKTPSADKRNPLLPLACGLMLVTFALTAYTALIVLSHLYG